jgi:hypothetical protein
MLTRMLFLLGLILCGSVVLTGAWPASFAPVAPDAESAFVPKVIVLDADIIGSGIDARQLLEKALGKLGVEEAGWLNTKIRQTVYGADSRFVAEGFLQRGPNQCARMEMEVVAEGGSPATSATGPSWSGSRQTSGAARACLVIVSDGEILAQVQKLPGVKPTATVERLPALTQATHEKDQAARAAFLAAKGCGGPAALLRPIQQHLLNGTLQTGLLCDRPVIQLKARLDPAKVPAFSAAKLAALSACVYLDARTLWPMRIEWSGAHSGKAARPLLQIEFRAPIVGVALEDEECAHMFSYRPDGSEHVKEIQRR